MTNDEKKVEYEQMMDNLGAEKLVNKEYGGGVNTLADLYIFCRNKGIEMSKEPAFDFNSYCIGREWLKRRIQARATTNRVVESMAIRIFEQEHPIRLDTHQILADSDEETTKTDKDLQRADLFAVTIHVYNLQFAEEVEDDEHEDWEHECN